MKTQTSKTTGLPLAALLTVIICVALSFAMMAADVDTNSVPLPDVSTSPLPATTSEFWVYGIAVIVPLIVGGMKKLLPILPKWSLAVSTPFVGMALGGILKALGALDMGWIDMAQAGGLAVLVRESWNKIVTENVKGEEGAKTKGPEDKPYIPPALILFTVTMLAVSGCKAPDGTYDPAQTEQVKQALEPAVRTPVRRIIMNSPQHADELATYFRAVAGVFCKMATEKKFDPATLTSGLQVVIPPRNLANQDVQMLIDFKLTLEQLYKLFWHDRFSAELPPESWVLHLSDYFCTAIDNGLKDAGQVGAK